MSDFHAPRLSLFTVCRQRRRASWWVAQVPTTLQPQFGGARVQKRAGFAQCLRQADAAHVHPRGHCRKQPAGRAAVQQHEYAVVRGRPDQAAERLAQAGDAVVVAGGVAARELNAALAVQNVRARPGTSTPLRMASVPSRQLGSSVRKMSTKVAFHRVHVVGEQRYVRRVHRL